MSLKSIIFLFLIAISCAAELVTKPSTGRRITIFKDEDCDVLPEAPPEEDDPVPELFDLLDLGTDFIRNYSYANEAILALGNTGSGKSTVTQIMAGNMSKLHAVLAPGDNLVIIDEDNKIGYPTTKSKTLVPDLILRQENGTAELPFYDNPGFDDNRGPVLDIGANYFMNYITSHKIEKVKLLFLVVHKSVELGGDKIDFNLLAGHAATFVKNFEKYSPSFALIVNKVNSFNGRGQYIQDHTIMEGVGAFLQSYNTSLHSELGSGSPSKDQLTRNKINFVENLMVIDKITGNFTRIWFVRSPIDCGPLSESEMMMDTKRNLTKLYEDLQYTTIDTTSDFGFTLKSETKEEIGNYTEYINQNITLEVTAATQTLEDAYDEIDFIHLNLTKLTMTMEQAFAATKNFKEKMESGELTNSIQLFENISPIWRSLDVDLPRGFEDYMIQQEDYLAFFEKVAEKSQPRHVEKWGSPIQAFTTRLNLELLNVIENFNEQINQNITAAITAVTNNLIDVYTRSIKGKVEIDQLYLTQLSSEMENSRIVLKEFEGKLDSKDVSNSIEFMEEMISVWREFQLYLSTNFKDFMIRQEEHLAFFDMVTEKTQTRKVDMWRDSINKFLEIFYDDADWLSYCNRLDTELKTYDFQNSKQHLPPKKESESWIDFIERNQIISGTAQIRPITEKMTTEKLNIVTYLMEFSTQSMTYHCMDDFTMVFQENFVRMDEVVQKYPSIISMCKYTQEIYIIASHTIFMDFNHVFGSLSVTLIAPYWINPINEYKILNFEAPPLNFTPPSRAADGLYGSGQRGTDGCAGRPGNHGGSFLGIVEEMVSQSALLITTRGSNGEIGQAGGDGGSGTGSADADCKYDACEGFPVCINPGNYGGVGGTGGNGGVGGASGKAGHLILTNFKNGACITLMSADGAVGINGTGGRGGEGGRPGNGYTRTFHVVGEECKPTPPTNGREVLRKGVEGIPGESRCQYKTSVPWTILEYERILHYKRIFVNQTHMPHPSTTSFISDLDLNFKTEIYHTLGSIIEDFLFLEDLRRETRLNPAHQLDRLYGNLIGKLERYSEKNFDSTTKELQKLISMLLTSSCTTFLSLNQNGGVTHIVDVTGYFLVVKKQIADLRSLKAVIVIQKAKQEFEADLHKKVDQALFYIEESVTPAIIGAGEEVERELAVLAAQLEELVRDARLSLEEAKNQLREGEKKNKKLKIIKIFSTLVSVGAALGGGEEFSGLADIVDKLRDTFQGNEADLKRLKELVAEAEKLVEDLEEKKEYLEEHYKSLVKGLMEYYKNVKEKLNSGEDIGEPTLGITKWEVTNKLKDCKAALEELSDTGLSMHQMVRSFDRIYDAMTMMIDLYDMIDKYMETKKLAGYIATVNSADLSPIPITDPKLTMYVREFEVKIKEDLAYQEATKALHAFRQWVFPFAKFYPFEVPAPSGVGQIGEEQLSLVNDLGLDLEKYKTGVVGSMDTFIIQQNFSSGIKTSKPFYTWKNSYWYKQIQELLMGQVVDLDADVRQQGFMGWEAIKFKLIEINLKLNNDASEEMQTEFADLIEYFGVRMTHSGVSSYRFQENYYSITGNNQTIVYNFERDVNGNRLGTNMVYEKFKSGDYLLSPFTLWTIQLKHVVPLRKGKTLRTNVGLEDLEKFLPFMDVELVGMGTYVDGEEALNAARGDLQLERFYQRDERQSLEIQF